MQTIRNVRDSDDSILGQPKREMNLDHMVDSYEIYGEGHPDDSNDSGRQRKRPTAQNPSSKQRRRNDKPSQAAMADQSRKSASGHQQRKQRSQPREQSSGMKNTQIEVLDHETPIEEYQ